MTEPLFPQVSAGHLCFSLCDPAHSVSLGDHLQVHLIELSKYDVGEEDLSEADWLEHWVYFFVESANREADDLRRLLPNPTFQKATGILEMIARSPDLRLLYDDRAKEEKDKFSLVKDAHAQGKAQGKAEGEARGEARGKLIGRIQLLQQLLALASSEEAALSKMDEVSLATLAGDLQQRLQNRS